MYWRSTPYSHPAPSTASGKRERARRSFKSFRTASSTLTLNGVTASGASGFCAAPRGAAASRSTSTAPPTTGGNGRCGLRRWFTVHFLSMFSVSLSRPAALLLVNQECDQVDELLRRERLLQALGHRALGLGLVFLDLLLRDNVLLALAVSDRDSLRSFGDARAGEHAAVLQDDQHGLETRGDGAAGLEDGLDQVDAREAASHPGQLRADPLPLFAEAVTLHAL